MTVDLSVLKRDIQIVTGISMNDLEIKSERLVDHFDWRRAHVANIERRLGFPQRFDVSDRKVGANNKQVGVIGVACGGSQPVELFRLVLGLVRTKDRHQNGIAVEEAERGAILVREIINE